LERNQLTPSEKAKDARLRKTYKITLEAQNKQRSEQSNACTICGRPFSKFTPFQDHEHQCCPRRLKEFCGKCNRGLLCFVCNKYVVGVLERQSVGGKRLDPIWLLKRILVYFEHWTPILKARGAYAAKEKSKKLLKK
jgi:hypothetical protein